MLGEETMAQSVDDQLRSSGSFGFLVLTQD